jgi:hypothetical protein
VPPQFDQAFGCRRGRQPGQPLAHHHGDRILDWRVGAIRDIAKLAPMKPIIKHGREISGYPQHALRADCLDPSLLD